jgi:hypothetical protein
MRYVFEHEQSVRSLYFFTKSKRTVHDQKILMLLGLIYNPRDATSKNERSNDGDGEDNNQFSGQINTAGHCIVVRDYKR